MTEDPVTAAVQFDDQEAGPAVDLNYWIDFLNTPTEKFSPSNPLAVDPSTDPEILAEVQRNWDEFRTKAAVRAFGEEVLLNGVEKVYSTAEAAHFFGKSNQWVYWGLRQDPDTEEQVFTYKDGSPILPERVGKMGKRRFSLPIIREIALSCFRRGNLSEEELQEIMAKVLVAEFGRLAFADTE